MTPFDGGALLVMLLTFYPVVSVAALRRARAERPEYFAGGELFGTQGEKLRLPDGRVFDLIYDVEGFSGGPKWQVIEPGPGGDDATFPLETGPLAPIDQAVALLPPLEPIFEDLVAAHLVDIHHDADAMGVQREQLASAGTGAEVDDVFESTIGAAAGSLDDELRAFEDLDPSGVVASTLGLGGAIVDAQTDYRDPEGSAPPEMTGEPQTEPDPPYQGPGGDWAESGV